MIVYCVMCYDEYYGMVESIHLTKSSASKEIEKLSVDNPLSEYDIEAVEVVEESPIPPKQAKGQIRVELDGKMVAEL